MKILESIGYVVHSNGTDTYKWLLLSKKASIDFYICCEVWFSYSYYNLKLKIRGWYIVLYIPALQSQSWNVAHA